MNEITQGNCLETLKTFQDKSVNCIITDPPYGDAMASQRGSLK